MPALAYAIHWFRRDLRLDGNPAFLAAAGLAPGRVLGLVAIDPELLAREDIGSRRYAYWLDSVGSLRAELGGSLLVVEDKPERAFERLFHRLRESGRRLPEAVFFNRDYEPFARARDSAIEEGLFERHGVRVETHRDHLLIEPRELTKDGEGTYYKVYSAFRKKWLAALETDGVQARLRESRRRAPPAALDWKAILGPKLAPEFPDALAPARKKAAPGRLPKAGPAAALAELRDFGRSRLGGYAKLRDFPAVNGTSRLSIHLKTGATTVARAIAELGLKDGKFLDELIWREFYYHLLYHAPRVETETFQARYRDLRWENDRKLFKAWKEGRTGYPIVDAAMRQLAETGWMHNRLRMIVASFLTKDLLVDYRWGERHFMRELLDGDLAPNNGGWQWAASTGCDPQPYFRVFNPTLQGIRFDPKGEFVRKWMPELRDRPDRRVHEPMDAVVDHAARAKQAIALFRGSPTPF